MTAHVIDAETTQSNTSDKLRKGKIRIYTTTTVYWVIGENPVASNVNCAVLNAGDSIELNLPVNCSRLAVLAAKEPGVVTVTEITGGTRPSCSY